MAFCRYRWITWNIKQPLICVHSIRSLHFIFNQVKQYIYKILFIYIIIYIFLNITQIESKHTFW